MSDEKNKVFRFDEYLLKYIFLVENKISEFMIKKIKEYNHLSFIHGKKQLKRSVRVYEHEDYPGDFKLKRPTLKIGKTHSFFLLAFSLFHIHIINTKLIPIMKNKRKIHLPVKLGYGFLVMGFLIYFNYNFTRYCLWRHQIYELGKRMYIDTEIGNSEFKYMLREK